MTTLLEKAFAEASKLPQEEQDALAAILLREIQADARWEEAFSESTRELEALADEAIKEFHDGKTLPLDPDDL